MLIPETLAQTGYAVLPGLLSPDDRADLIALYNRPEPFRKTIVMERFRFGRGEYKYFQYPLPAPCSTCAKRCIRRWFRWRIAGWPT